MVVLLLGVEFLYVCLGNWYFNSDAFRRRVNSRPDHLFVEWTSVRTWYPGAFHVRDLVMIGQGSRDVWYGAMHEGRFGISIVRLFQREVFCRRFEGVGVEFRLRLQDVSEPGAVESHSPPIPGLEGLPRRSDARRARSTSRWSVRVDKVNIEQVAQIWIRGLRLQGASRIEGEADLAAGGAFRGLVNRYEIPEAILTLNGTTVSTNLFIRLEGGLGPLVFADSKGEKLYSFLDAHLWASGELLDVSMFGPGARASGGLDFGGDGQLDADIRVRHGVYQPGSALSIVSTNVGVQIGRYSLRGDARIEDRIEASTGQAKAQLQMRVSNLQLWHRGQRVSGAVGSELTLESTASNLRMVGRFRDADLRFRLSPMTVPDLGLVNQYVPPGLGTLFHSGQIAVVSDFSRTPSGAFSGRIALNGQGLGASIRARDYRVDLQLDARFESDPADVERFDISGSSLVLTNVIASATSAGTDPDWHARVDVRKGVLVVKPSWAIESEAGLVLHDTLPVLAVLRSTPDAPGWLGLLPTLRDVEGRVGVGVSADRLTLDQIDIIGKSSEILGNLELKGSALRGLLYFRHGVISIGLDMRETRRHWHVIGARHWFDGEMRLEQAAIPSDAALR